jgi:hypothetical protein
MDPYIELYDLWEDFHHSLITDLKRALSAVLPDRYTVLIGERSYVVLTANGGQTEHPMQVDVGVAEAAPVRESAPSATGLAVAAGAQVQPEPVTMRALLEMSHREIFLEIRELHPARRLITSIEILSPSNKRRGAAGWRLYTRKRQVYLEGHANLVEIDLLRRGRRMPMEDEWPASPYYYLACRRERAPECTVWPASFREPLPAITVPLVPPDPDVYVAMQPLVDTIYASSHYARLIDYDCPLRPRLNPADALWWEQRLRDWRATL